MRIRILIPYSFLTDSITALGCYSKKWKNMLSFKIKNYNKTLKKVIVSDLKI